MNTLQKIIEDLVASQFSDQTETFIKAEKLCKNGGIGYSQFNELLLLLGKDRVSSSFFQFLVSRTHEYVSGSAITDLGVFRSNVDEFRVYAMLRFGSISFAYQQVSKRSSEDMRVFLDEFKPIDEAVYTKRHDELIALEPIDAALTYYLGYVVQSEIKSKLAKNPSDAWALSEKEKMDKIIEQGTRNQMFYLVSDHLDVYVATSMREKHEFVFVNKFVTEVFGHENLKRLKIRYFDPTQAYCADRIDKGLSEGLMLKRANLTLYLAQETDTLGKDSELASTLAQGKAVIAYVPRVDDPEEYARQLVSGIAKLGEQDLSQIIRDQLKIFCGSKVWDDQQLQGWLTGIPRDQIDLAIKILGQNIKSVYDKRANVLADVHPLGIQVNIETGVANGVLVARTPEQCALLVEKILLGTLKLKIQKEKSPNTGKPNVGDYLSLRDEHTESIFRIVTGDRFLTHSFWNFF